MTDVLIIGAGPAGLTAAIYAARAGVAATVFEKNIYGGQISLTSAVDNYPALPGVPGVQFANDLYDHALAQGAEVLFDEVEAAQLAGPIKTVTAGGTVYEGRTIIIAGGAAPRRLGCTGETEYTGRGVSYCATCDAAFYRGKTVAIVGGGDTALGDALFLANHCQKVYLVHRRTAFRGQVVLQNAVHARANIEIITPATVAAIEGGTAVEQVVLDTPDGQRRLAVDGLFVAVGQTAETALYQNLLPLDENGYILAGEDCATPLPGVFVAGDLRKKPLRQIVTAAADGAVAAVAAAEYCNAQSDASRGA
ncbi:FAD-dependent oxidoreductase [Ruminococcaceae bacterium OttesenSCG-928-O06]|nr:FAD-dependent oxidoreductase [Ruminococcaceae bacterium OttesenSCG-928-O06]